MNISSEISLSSNSSDFIFLDDTTAETYFYMNLLVDIFTFLVNFPINSYVIWLILRGSGNGLAAEIFILSLSICEIFLCVKCVFNIIISYRIIYEDIGWMLVALFDGLVTSGCPLFQSLICVERYLAVVHPVTFLKYKPLRYRLMCCAVAWMIIFGFGVLNALISFFDLNLYLIPFIQFFITFFIQLFCCVAVLRALKQSGPGERGREREEENHMKRRAFNLILITTVSMAITYLPMIITITLHYSIEDNLFTGIYISNICFVLNGLVQPIMFFHRVGKLNFIRCQ